MFALRDYQSDLIDRARHELRTHRSVLVQAPTGAGKTALAAFMIASAAQRGKRAWFVCHRDFLLTQTAGAFDAVGVPYGYIAAGMPANPYQAIQIASVGSLARRLHKLAPPDLIVWDEAHHVAAKTWASIFRWASVAHHVGLSATPARLDGRGLGDFFGAMVHGPSVGRLIADGYLSRYRAFAPSTPDLGRVHTRAGDYVTRELAGVMDTSTIAGNIVGQYCARAIGRSAIYYAVSIEHSQHLAASFQASGVNARHLDGTASAAERLDAATALGDGRISVLSNVDLFGEGFDLGALAPGATIECVGLCRPTQSPALHLQQIGRALRPKPEPAIILDHAGNLMRHGLPDDPREWGLDGIDRKSRNADNGPPVRTCERCYGVFGAGTRTCPYCGHEAEIAAREVEEVDADLAEIDRDLLQAARHREVQRARTMEDLIRVGTMRGYKSPAGWARHVLKAREGHHRRLSA